LEMNSFFTLHSFLEVGKTQDLPSKFCQTFRDADMHGCVYINYGSLIASSKGSFTQF
jgi:hypothetical protein